MSRNIRFFSLFVVMVFTVTFLCNPITTFAQRSRQTGPLNAPNTPSAEIVGGTDAVAHQFPHGRGISLHSLYLNSDIIVVATLATAEGSPGEFPWQLSTGGGSGGNSGATGRDGAWPWQLSQQNRQNTYQRDLILNIRSVIKGAAPAQVTVRETAASANADTLSRAGESMIFFLDQEGGVYHASVKLRGDLPTVARYAARLGQLHNIYGSGGNTDTVNAQVLNWLVEVAADPVTRLDGACGLKLMLDGGSFIDPLGKPEGSGIDPHGRDEGNGLDPHGRASARDSGVCIDPNGRTFVIPHVLEREEGSGLDPYGRGLGMDPNGRPGGVDAGPGRAIIDPNGRAPENSENGDGRSTIDPLSRDGGPGLDPLGKPEGSGLDPHGKKSGKKSTGKDEGPYIDPNGKDEGSHLDPNGKGDGGGFMDPNGKYQGSGIDPNGRGAGLDPNGKGDQGASIDPLGKGMGLDPNGKPACAKGDYGCGMDPDGKVFGMDPNGKGAGLDPNGRGGMIDPNGRGFSIDPNGWGPTIDPNGKPACAKGDNGCGIDPNGRGGMIDPNGRGFGIDPNGRDGGPFMDPNGRRLTITINRYAGVIIDPNGRDAGPVIDPSGSAKDSGPRMDDNGASKVAGKDAGVRMDDNGKRSLAGRDTSSMIDPMGRTSSASVKSGNGDEGPGLDPNGRGWGIDPNGKGILIDPNGGNGNNGGGAMDPNGRDGAGGWDPNGKTTDSGVRIDPDGRRRKPAAALESGTSIDPSGRPSASNALAKDDGRGIDPNGRNADMRSLATAWEAHATDTNGRDTGACIDPMGGGCAARDAGSSMDPNGGVNNVSVRIDPNGRDAGPAIDPTGRCAGDYTACIDPNGKPNGKDGGSCIDPGGKTGSCIDPNGNTETGPLIIPSGRLSAAQKEKLLRGALAIFANGQKLSGGDLALLDVVARTFGDTRLKELVGLYALEAWDSDIVKIRHNIPFTSASTQKGIDEWDPQVLTRDGAATNAANPPVRNVDEWEGEVVRRGVDEWDGEVLKRSAALFGLIKTRVGLLAR